MSTHFHSRSPTNRCPTTAQQQRLRSRLADHRHAVGDGIAVGAVRLVPAVDVNRDRGGRILVVQHRIVPRLALTGAKDVVEGGTEHVHAGRNEEDDLPLGNGRLCGETICDISGCIQTTCAL